MKKFTTLLLSVIFVTLIAGSVQYVAADHLEPGQGIYKNEMEINTVVTNDSNYQIYLQTVIRNVDGQLISVVENTAIGGYVPHKITDAIFDTLMGKVKPVTIDGIEYDKVTFTFIPAPISSRIAGIPSGVAGTLIITFGTLRRENSRFASSTVPFVS